MTLPGDVSKSSSAAPGHVAVSGASGFVGTRLLRHLQAEGWRVSRLVRVQGASAPGGISWDPATGEIDAAALEDVDAVINLSGENLAGGRWNRIRKSAILNSRVQSTALLCRALAESPARPRTLISASAVGYYGPGGEAVVDENSPPGGGFLADVCRAWEAATAPAQEAGVRVVQLRIGMVLSGEGGALGKMLLPFRLGLGGRLGHGGQYMSWIAMADLLQAVSFALNTPALAGPVNAVSPGPVSNAEFTRTLGRVLRRPTLAAVPAFAVRLVFGEMGQALLLEGQRVRPGRLLDEGFSFRHPTLEEALRAALER